MPKLSAADHLCVRKLLLALRRLEPDQGERARRNARQRVLARLRALREAVDRDYPAPVLTKPAKRKRRRDPTADQPRMRSIYSGAFAAGVAKAGIRVIPTDNSGYVFVPAWVADLRNLDPTIRQLREARRSLTARRALLAQARLTQQGAKP